MTEIHPALFAASLDQGLPTVDLHQFTDVRDAAHALDRQAFRLSSSGIRSCRVIYGIGSGRLKEVVIESIKRNPMFGDYLEEDTGGSLVVLL